MATRIISHPDQEKRVKHAMAAGMGNFGRAVETDWKRDAVVAGGHRSTNPDGPVGGTFRRSILSVAYLDGQPLDRPSDDNGQAAPAYQGHAAECGVFIGSNCGYGLFVEAGTNKMAARPALIPAIHKNQEQGPKLDEAGMKAYLKGSAL